MRIQSSILAIALTGCAVDADPPMSDEPAAAPADDLAARVTPRVMSQLAMSSSDALELRAHIPERDGLQYLKYRQTYRGVRVAHGHVSVILRGDDIRHVADHTLAGIDIDVTPRITKDDAVARVLVDIGHGEMASRAELVIDTEFEKRVSREGRDGAPVNAADITKVPTKHVLVWQVLVGDGYQSMAYVVDATTGVIRDRFDPASADTNVTVWANTEYHGTQMIDAVKNDPDACGTFAMIDWKRGHSVFASYDSRITIFSASASFGDADPPTADYSTGSGCDSRLGKPNAQTAAADAEFGFGVGWDLYKNVFSFPGWGGSNEQAAVYVHWQANDSEYRTDPFGDHINVGDGHWQTGGTPHATIDIMAHEYTHAVDGHVGSLGLFGHSTQISEGIADLGGVFANLYYHSGNWGNAGSTVNDTGNQDDFEVFHGIAGSGIRVLDRPSQDSTPSPNFYSADIDNLDVHQSSGPLRRAFYFIMKGSSPHDDWRTQRAWHSNTPLLPWGLKGIGVDKTSKLFFHTFFGCLDDGETQPARDCAEIVALELFGLDAVPLVRNAFAGVNVGNVTSDYPAPPDAFLEQEPNENSGSATDHLHWTASPDGFENIFKMTLLGFINNDHDVDDYAFTAKCGRHLGALLQQPVDLSGATAPSMRLFIQNPTTGNWSAMGAATNPATIDPTLGVDTQDFCSGTGEQHFILKVQSNGDRSIFPYAVRLDAQ